MEKRIKWSADPAHSDIVFKVKYLMISYIKGAFKIFDASVIFSFCPGVEHEIKTLNESARKIILIINKNN